MYKHILIPTDGSETADKGVKAGLKFAKWAGARVTVFTAMPEYRMPTASEVAARRVMPIAEYERRAMAQAKKRLDGVARRAKAAGVKLDAEAVLSDRPAEAIIEAARKKRCDLIFLASHGRRGLSALLNGSYTETILRHSKTPTLVYR
jgi:nucleotide-binding universal stress UspA family protein